MNTVLKTSFSALLLSLLLGCGDSSLVDDTKAGSYTWQPNVFNNSAQFKNLCSNPRSGQDITGASYPDRAGSTLQENLWLRSWSNNTYLWYSDIKDQNPSLFKNPTDYFDVLKTNALSPSGIAKDQFHFSQKTEDYLQLVSGDASLEYGMRLLFSSGQIDVAYVEDNSPAANANIQRGDKILAANGITIATVSEKEVPAVNAALFPESASRNRFTIQAANSDTTRTVTISPTLVTAPPVKNTKIIETDAARIGYLTFNTFSNIKAEKALLDAFTVFKDENVNDLVIDLRYNGGGYLYMASQIAYMVAGEQSNDKVFERTVFNDKHPSINPVTGQQIVSMPFISSNTSNAGSSEQPLPSVNLNRVYILSSGNTCSASEAVINGLRGIDVEVILIGSTTCGKPYGFYPTDNCGTTYFTVQFRGENHKGFGDYSDGFTPSNTVAGKGESVKGCDVGDDLSRALGDVNEGMLSAALHHQRTGSCPSNTRVSTRSSRSEMSKNPLLKDPRIQQRLLLERSRINNLPN